MILYYEALIQYFSSSDTSGQLVEFIREHPDDEDWWEAKNENGDIGYVPSTYVIVKKEHVRIYLIR